MLEKVSPLLDATDLIDLIVQPFAARLGVNIAGICLAGRSPGYTVTFGDVTDWAERFS